MFRIDPAFEATSEPLAELELCQARLQDDARFPWIVLIPRRPGLRELEELSAEDRVRLMDEVLAAGRAVRAIGHELARPVEKLNVGALGNVTPQLHVHVVGRRADDAAWPGPVWGVGEARRYRPAELATALVTARDALG
ncbi:HIT domain-containing protein [Phenylobacterium sp. VNQ135]|uniref:HIT domain-containing protein n=1 Tax=Phenylobacterium sp. VNQ135 TaxID=3400922 RepID=UPI003C0EE171